MKIIKNNILMMKYIATFCPNHILLTIVNSILSSVIPIFYILFTRYVINSLTYGADFNKVLFIIIAFLIFNICYAFFTSWFQQVATPKNTQILNQKMQAIIFKKTLELDLSCYEDVDFYNKFSMALQQSDTRALAVLNTFSTFIGNLFGITTLITMISSFEPLLLIAILVNVLIAIFINTKVIKIQHKYYEERIPYQREIQYVNRVFYQREYAKEFRIFSGFPPVIMRIFNNSVNKLILLLKTFGKKLSRFYGAQNAISALVDAIIMLYLAYKVILKSLNVGDFVALSGSAQQLFSQLTQFINIFPQLYEHSVYTENFEEFMNYKPSIHNDKSKMEFKNNSIIEFRNLSFVYPNTEKTVLKGINIKIYSGEKIAFVGYNGAGKSTLIKLLTRLYDPTEGQIILDGIDCKKYNVTSIRKNIGIIFQDYQMFSVSIAENILMRPIINREDDEDTVYKALKQVGLYDKIHSMENGIYTVLSREFTNSGAIFSGGEFQKLAIARIYAQKSNIIILDEPSSALDPIAENEFFNSVLDFVKDKTIILISHRMTNVNNVDRIFFIENGSIIEAGSHEELMSLDGKYAEMYKVQANKFILPKNLDYV
jgi:ATP-binding cassette, subfamily B, bacterial